MSSQDQDAEAPPRGSLEFVESSVLDTFIPLATDLNIEEALSGSVQRLDIASSPLSDIPQRDFLFFGKHLNLNVGHVSYLFPAPR